MIRILLGVRELTPNARFGLDIGEVWVRCPKLSSVRRSSNTNERPFATRKPMHHNSRSPNRATLSVFQRCSRHVFGSTRPVNSLVGAYSPGSSDGKIHWKANRLSATPLGEKLRDGLNPSALDRSPGQRCLQRAAFFLQAIDRQIDWYALPVEL